MRYSVLLPRATTARVYVAPDPDTGEAALAAELLRPDLRRPVPLVDPRTKPDVADPRLWCCGLASRMMLHDHVDLFMRAALRAYRVKWSWGQWSMGACIHVVYHSSFAQTLIDPAESDTPLIPTPAAARDLFGWLIEASSAAVAHHRRALAVAAAMAASLGGGHAARLGVVCRGSRVVFDANLDHVPPPGHPLHPLARHHFARTMPLYVCEQAFAAARLRRATADTAKYLIGLSRGLERLLRRRSP